MTTDTNHHSQLGASAAIGKPSQDSTHRIHTLPHGRGGQPPICLHVLLTFLAVVAPHATHAQETEFRRVEINDPLPYGQTPIDYFGRESADAVARLQDRIAAGEIKLTNKVGHGYLPALLEALNVPIQSQLLVYSKTALNQRLIGPQTPRAIYFNDEVAIAWVPGAPDLEILAIDPIKGGMFYSLHKSSMDKAAEPVVQLKRNQRCLACHVAATTMRVPGGMIRSFVTNKTGKPLSGYSQINHMTAINKRWGGWYVTGTHGAMPHRGNLIGQPDLDRHRREPTFAANRLDLSAFLDTGPYLSPHSDIVAQLVFNHQVHGQNLLIRVGYETRLNRRSNAELELLRYLLFVDEPALVGPVAGTSGYRRWFERQARKDKLGRSLCEFDLKTRMFRFRLSYLIYSRLFDSLPDSAKMRIYRRLWDVLSGHDLSGDFQEIPREEKQTIRQILTETKTDLPGYWFDSP